MLGSIWKAYPQNFLFFFQINLELYNTIIFFSKNHLCWRSTCLCKLCKFLQCLTQLYMLHLWEKLWLELCSSHTCCRYQLKKPVEYWHPFSKQLNLFLEQLIKLTHLSSTKLQCLLSLVFGTERTNLVKYFLVLLSLLLLIRQFYHVTCANDIIRSMSPAVFIQWLWNETCLGKCVTSCIGAHKQNNFQGQSVLCGIYMFKVNNKNIRSNMLRVKCMCKINNKDTRTI